MPKLSLALIGHPEIALEPRPLDATVYQKARTILAFLAVEQPRRYQREELALLFWPDASREAGLSRLRHALHCLRRALDEPADPPYLLTTRGSVAFNPHSAHWLDVTEFTSPLPSCVAACAIPAASPKASDATCEACLDRMEQTAALYRGPFLDGLVLNELPEFDTWLAAQRETLRQRAIELVGRIAACHEERGSRLRSLPFARRHAALDPGDDAAHQRVMRLLAQNGQPQAALHHFETFASWLADEMATTPHESTVSLAARIRADTASRQRQQVAAPDADVPIERRQASVLYTTFTPIGEHDTELAQEALIATHRRAREIAIEYGGHVMPAHGGLLLAYFGAPLAHEKAAHNAVCAALQLQLLHSTGMQIRSGVHTGQLVSSAHMPDMDGITSGIALQLCDRDPAVANRVTISDATSQQVAGFFVVEALGRFTPRGAARTIETYRVVARTGAHHRLDTRIAARRGALPAIAGRLDELAALVRVWRETQQGGRRVVLLRGEAGIGKSRLLHAFEERLKGERYVLRKHFAFQGYSRTPFHPITAGLESQLGFAPGDSWSVKEAKLRAHLGADQARLATPLAALLVPTAQHAPEDDAQRQREQIQQALVDLIERDAAREPMLWILEDAHWADPSTLNQLERFALARSNRPILILITARPEFEPGWKACQVIELGPLRDAHIMALTAQLGVAKRMSVQIVARANGNALFAEELAQVALSDPGGKLHEERAVPLTLRDLLTAQLDAVGEARRTAQIAAALGPVFDLQVLAQISSLERSTLEHAIASLVDAGLIAHQRDSIYRFHHDLIQQTAYTSQVRADRLATHARIAQVLENEYPDIVRDTPELLAQHFSAAGNEPKAIDYWLRAGQQAAQRFAHQEAIEHAREGLRMANRLPDGAQKYRREFALLLQLGISSHFAQGYGSPAAEKAFLRALELAEEIDDDHGLFNGQWGYWECAASRADFSEAVRRGKQLLALAQRRNDPTLLQQAHYALGNSLCWSGELAASRMHLERSIALEAPGDGAPTRDIYDRTTPVMSRAYLVWVLWLQGLPDEAETTSRQAITLARRYGHPRSLASVLTLGALYQRWRGSVEHCVQLAEEGLALAVKYNSTVFKITNTMCLSWAAVMRGDHAAIAQMEQSVHSIRKAMSAGSVSLLAPLIEALLHLGDARRALEVADEALGEVDLKNDRHWAAELHRLKGECLRLLGEAAGARRCFETAVEISRLQGAVALERRALASLRAHD